MNLETMASRPLLDFNKMLAHAHADFIVSPLTDTAAKTDELTENTPWNDWRKHHIILRPTTPEESLTNCSVCKAVQDPWHRGGTWSTRYKQFSSSLEDLRQAAHDGSCRFCATVWAAFKTYPPEAGWPPPHGEVTIRFRTHTRHHLSFGLVLDVQEESEPDHHGLVRVKHPFGQ